MVQQKKTTGDEKLSFSDGSLEDLIDTEPQPSVWLKTRALISAMLINILIGSYYVYGNINEYCANFIGVPKDQTLFIQPLWLFIQGGGVVFSIRLCEKFGYRQVNFWSFFVYILTCLSCAWIQNIWLFFLSFGVISGIAVGFGYLPSLYIAWTYFPESKSTATGSILFFAGLSTQILAPLSTAIVNPNDMDPSDPEVAKNVPKMWYYISGLYTVIFLISVSLQPPSWDPEEERKKHIEKIKLAETKTNNENEEKLLDKENDKVIDSPTKLRFKNSLQKVRQVVPINMSETDPSSTIKTIAQETEEQKFRANKSYEVILGENAGFRMEERASENFDVLDKQIFEAIDRKIVENDVKGVLGEGDAYIVANTSAKNMHCIQSRKFKTDYMLNLSRKLASEHNDSEASKRIMSALIAKDMYKVSKEIIDSECPSIYYGIRSYHYLQMITVVTTSMCFDYFLNAQWKTYGQEKLRDKDGNTISDATITNVMIIASLMNAFVRVFVGKLLQTVSYKKFYLCLVGLKIISAFLLQLSTHNIYTYTICISYAYMCIGSQSTLFPTFAVKVFGSKVGAKMFPLIYFFFAIANVQQWAQNYFIFTGDQGVLIYILAGMTVLAFILTFFINEKPNWYKVVQKHNMEERQKQQNLLNKPKKV